MVSMLWNKVEHTVVVNPQQRDELSELGFTIATRLAPETLTELKAIYQHHHSIKSAKGGMFYSVYSLDTNYRKTIHGELEQALSATYQTLFTGYKSVLNSFIIKMNGTESEFTLHQDSTGLDEFSYSPLSVWIPLQDTSIQNGCLCVVPKSHRIKNPYRGISFSGPFDSIQSTIREYLQPIELQAGDVLLFDNRLLHYSPANQSSAERVVVMSGIFPQEATLRSCYMDTAAAQPAIEIFQQPDDFLLTGQNFYHDCTIRPTTGTLIQTVQPLISPFNSDSFESLAQQLQIPKTQIPEMLNMDLHMQIISEPNQSVQTSSWKDKVLSLFR